MDGGNNGSIEVQATDVIAALSQQIAEMAVQIASLKCANQALTKALNSKTE